MRGILGKDVIACGRQMAERQGVIERLKAEDQMLWVQKMNGIRSRAEEMMRAEWVHH